MIQVEQHGPITSIRMARSFLGKPLYWTTAYWVDGLLIDTGPRCAAPELVRILQQVQVDQIVVTHGHEDTFGGLSATTYAAQDAILPPLYLGRARCCKRSCFARLDQQ